MDWFGKRRWNGVVWVYLVSWLFCGLVFGGVVGATPIISEGPDFESRFHMPNKDSNEKYFGINSSVLIGSDQGLDAISSVVAKFPDGSFFETLYDDGEHCDDGPGDGIYGFCSELKETAWPLGTYSVVVTDEDGNSVTGNDEVEWFIYDIPNKIFPANGDQVNTTAPTFEWAVGVKKVVTASHN